MVPGTDRVQEDGVLFIYFFLNTYIHFRLSSLQRVLKGSTIVGHEFTIILLQPWISERQTGLKRERCMKSHLCRFISVVISAALIT